jgi:hypothetical protein
MTTLMSLLVKIGADTSGLRTGMREAETLTGGLEDALGGVGIKAAGLAVAGAAVGALAGAIKLGLAEAMAWQDGIAQMDAGLKSTAGVAGVTKQSILDLSAAMQKNTKFSDDAVLSASNLALTFTGITKDIFPDVIRLSADMATGMKMDLNSALMQVAKSMQDPVAGATALRRSGVMLTDQQEALIKKLVESGNTMSAQKMILGELSTEFAGRAVAAGATFSGQITITKNSVAELAQKLGDPLLPALQKATEGLNRALNSRDAEVGVDRIAGAIESLTKALDANSRAWFNGSEGIKWYMDQLGRGKDMNLAWLGVTAGWIGQSLGFLGQMAGIKIAGQDIGGMTGQAQGWAAMRDEYGKANLAGAETTTQNWLLIDDAVRAAGGGFVGAIDSVAASIYAAKIGLTGGVERPALTGNWLLDEENTAAYLLKLDALNKEKDAARATADWYTRKAAGSNFITGGAATGMEIWTPGATPGALGGGLGAGLSMSFPDVLARAFGSMGEAQGWQGAFKSVQGREAGVTDVRDKMAGDMFSQKYGRAATQGEWEQRYYKGSFEGIDEKGAGLDDMFGKPGTWETLIGEQAKEDKKRVDELSLAFRKALRDDPLPVRVVGTPAGGGSDAATSSLQVEHFSTTLSRSRA